MRGLLPKPGHSNLLVWSVAALCAALAATIFFAGLVVLIIYLIYQPKMPSIAVEYAHLDKLDYDRSGLMDTQMTLTVVAENDNPKARASFSDTSFVLRFDGVTIAELRADPFGVPKNSTVAFNYIVPSAAVPLDERGMSEMDMGLKRNQVGFDLDGKARTRWRVGLVLSVRSWTHLSCRLQFFLSNGSSVNLDCSSKRH